MSLSCALYLILFITNVYAGIFHPNDEHLNEGSGMMSFPQINHVSTQAQDCISGPSWWYQGTRNYTENHVVCQRWDTNYPHVVRYSPGENDTNHNYCRNPDRDIKGTWCYTTDPNLRWNYCKIPKCEDDSLVVWTSFFPKTENSEIVSMLAEQELHMQKSEQGDEGFKSVAYSRRSDTEYWSIVGDYEDDRIFFTDYKSEMIGVVNLLTNITTSHFHGMAHGIEGLAYDWERKNLYWTDSALMWIMVADRNFQHYAPVYRADNPLYGIAVHVRARRIFFSTYKMVASKISSVDLSGKEEKVLVRFPKVYDVTGLTLDYTDDRIYWTDYNGSGGLVASCNLEGEDLTEHFNQPASQFWGIASYLDFLFVTDVHPRMTADMSELFFMWVIRKQKSYNDKAIHHSLQGKPRGVSVYSKNEERSLDADLLQGSCKEMPPCDHICLPRINSTRECVCSMGYHQPADDDTKCQPALIPDDYLVICDSGQGLIFQLPLNQSNPSFYSIVPMKTDLKALKARVDVGKGDIYWSSKHFMHPAIHWSSPGGEDWQVISPNVSVKVMEKDPITGNLYVVDDNSQEIKLMSYPNLHTKTIYSGSFPPPDILNSDVIHDFMMITNLAVDFRNKFLYWTTGSQDHTGQVWRSGLDGSDPQFIILEISWPTALTIDQKRQSLFVAEGDNPIIYEIPLDSITTAESKPKYRTYIISNFHDITPQVIDMKVHNDVLYYVDTQHGQVQTIQLIQEKDVSMTGSTVGPADFFDINSIDIFSSRYFMEYIANIDNPCLTVEPLCDHICVPTSSTTRQCLCNDGFSLVLDHKCEEVPTTAKPNTPPQALNCPDDLQFKKLPCQESILVNWEPPTWTDDKTATDDIRVVAPVPDLPTRLPAGSHLMEYFAADEDGAISVCGFEVTIISTDCGEPPRLPDDLEATKLSCQNESLSYVVSCVDGGEISVWTTGLLGPYITNVCFGPLGLWAIRDFSIYKCVFIENPTSPPMSTHSDKNATEVGRDNSGTQQQTTTRTVGKTETTTITTTKTSSKISTATTKKLTTTEEESGFVLKTGATEHTTTKSQEDLDYEKHVEWHTTNITNMIIGVCVVGGIVIIVIVFLMLKRRGGCRSWRSLPIDVKVLWRRREEERTENDPNVEFEAQDSSQVCAKMS